MGKAAEVTLPGDTFSAKAQSSQKPKQGFCELCAFEIPAFPPASHFSLSFAHCDFSWLRRFNTGRLPLFCGSLALVLEPAR